MADQGVHPLNDGFPAARRKGMGYASLRWFGLALLVAEAGIVAVMLGNLQPPDGSSPGVTDIVAATWFSVFAAMFIGPVVVVLLLHGLILEWFRTAPTWRRAARRRPTRVLHGVLLPEVARADGSVLRTVQVRTADVLPDLTLAFVEGAGEQLAGPVALELFARDRVAGPVRVSTADRAEWAYYVVVGRSSEVESPSVEVNVELSGAPTSPDLESYTVTVDQPSRQGMPLAPKGDGFRRARRAAFGRVGRTVVGVAITVLLPGGIIVLVVGDATDVISEEGTSGTLDPDNPWQLALLIAMMLALAVAGYSMDHSAVARLARIRPAWRRAARRRATLVVHGAMLPGTRSVGPYGARTVLLDGPGPERALELLFVSQEGWGERLAGPVTVELFAGELLRGPARVLDARRAEWAFATRDDEPGAGRWSLREDQWDDDGWTDLDGDGDSGGGDGDGGE
jgi:hypothetical protein